VVFEHNEFNYFVPFSSPKKSDFITLENGISEARKSIVPIIRITTTSEVTKRTEIKGTLKLSNMIPVPYGELKLYDPVAEKDVNYKIIVEKEIEFIRTHTRLILRNAIVLYNQKTKENELFKSSAKKPGYLASTIDFLYAEKKCKEFDPHTYPD
jgi:protein AbiQ